MSIRVLFVSIAFPPKSDAEGLQVAKYFHYLQQSKDLVIDVVTSAVPTINMPYDAALARYSSGYDQLIKIKLLENRYINYFITRIGLSKFLFPDLKYSFHKQSNVVLKELKKIPDVIYSRSDPKSSGLMAYKLKKKLGVPWIMHLSDPWADCPKSKFKGWLFKKHDKWEKICFESADIISFTSLPTIAFYKKKYPLFSDKFRFYPNVFEKSVRNDKITSDQFVTTKLRIVYTGGLAYDRTATFFIDPLKKMYEENPEISKFLEVIFAGDADSKNRSIFNNCSLPFIRWVGNVSFDESIKLQQSAHYLLAIDFPIDDPNDAMFFLSKLLDYMVAGKRILLLTVNGSASHEAIRDLKSDVCGRNDVDSIEKFLKRAINEYMSGNLPFFKNTSLPEIYDAEYNAKRLQIELKDVVKKSQILTA
jgi:glycosyltransferase involved in cell wall biosynthesis